MNDLFKSFILKILSLSNNFKMESLDISENNEKDNLRNQLEDMDKQMAEMESRLRKLTEENHNLERQLEEKLSNERNSEEFVQPRNRIVSPAIFENSHVLKELIGRSETPSGESNEASHNNDWTEKNEKTVHKWQTDIEKTSFIYGEVLLDKTLKMNVALVIALISSILNTLLAALAVTLAFLDLKWIGIGFEISILLSSGIAAVAMGLMKLFNLELRVEELIRFVEKLDNAWYLFEIELNMSSDQRTNATDFIKRADGQYLSLMQHCPMLNAREYSKANKRYQERLFDNYMWSQKFRKHVEQNMKEEIV